MSLSPLVYWAAAFLIISLLGLFISRKTVKIDLEKNGDLIIAMLTILGTLVSVLLGLLVSSADDQYRSLEASVNSEATSLNEVFRLSRGLPPATAALLQSHCLDYCEKVRTEEWPAMKHGQTSPAVTHVYAGLSDAIVHFRPANSGEQMIQAQLLNATSQVGQNRGLRVVASRSTWTHRLLPLIMTCAIVVLACSYLYAGKGNALLHGILTGLVAITLGTNIGVIFLMTRPFSSEWTIQPEGFELDAAVMRKYMGSVDAVPISTGATQKPQAAH
jgi:Protein of unknown function (DUF4239)